MGLGTSPQSETAQHRPCAFDHARATAAPLLHHSPPHRPPPPAVSPKLLERLSSSSLAPLELRLSRRWIAANGATTKPELHWEFNEARADGWQGRVAEAEHSRQAIEASFVHLLDAFDVLVCPCTLMHPFDKSLRYPARCSPPAEAPKGSAGWMMEDYVQWMLPCSVISLTGNVNAARAQRASQHLTAPCSR